MAKTFKARGVGQGALIALGKRVNAMFGDQRPAGIGDRELIRGYYDAVCAAGIKAEKAAIDNAYSEDADGDVVAAHIAWGNDYLCTEDRGKSGALPSIFDDENRAWLKSTHGVEILNAQELAALL